MSETGTILLVEDDQNVLRTNRRILEREGYRVLCAETLQDARACLDEKPDALVLDILMPDGSGLDFCTEIRTTTPVPVLFLTALDEKSEVIEGLVAGGSDYITKPYDVDEFLARVKAQLRLAAMNRALLGRRFSCGPLVLDMLAQRAYLGGQDMLLTQKEFSLLLVLMRSEGQTLSAEALYQAVWHMPMVGENRSLKKHLSTVRRKLEDGNSGYTIHSVYGKGYRFGPVE